MSLYQCIKTDTMIKEGWRCLCPDCRLEFPAVDRRLHDSTGAIPLIAGDYTATPVSVV